MSKNFEKEFEDLVYMFESEQFNLSRAYENGELNDDGAIDPFTMVYDRVEEKLSDSSTMSKTKGQKPVRITQDLTVDLSSTKKRYSAESVKAEEAFETRSRRNLARMTFNEHIDRAAGVHNLSANVMVFADKPVKPYDFFNLTCAGRTDALSTQMFKVGDRINIETGVETFNEFGDPSQGVQRLLGRVINLSQEETKLKENEVGLFNPKAGETTNQPRVKLNLSNMSAFALHEGQIITVEGFNGINDKFNVNNITLPKMATPPLVDSNELKKIAFDHAKDRSIQVMLACGPYTNGSTLNYAGLKEILRVA